MHKLFGPLILLILLQATSLSAAPLVKSKHLKSLQNEEKHFSLLADEEEVEVRKCLSSIETSNSTSQADELVNSTIRASNKIE
jgi:hypothetical protein